MMGEWLEKAGIVFAFDWTGAALAAGVMAFPLMVRPMRLAIEAIDREVDEVARTLGAGSVDPLLPRDPAAGRARRRGRRHPGLRQGAGEFGATITFVAAIPGETLTLPSAIYGATQSPGGRARAACPVPGRRCHRWRWSRWWSPTRWGAGPGRASRGSDYLTRILLTLIFMSG